MHFRVCSFSAPATCAIFWRIVGTWAPPTSKGLSTTAKSTSISFASIIASKVFLTSRSVRFLLAGRCDCKIHPLKGPRRSPSCRRQRLFENRYLLLLGEQRIDFSQEAEVPRSFHLHWLQSGRKLLSHPKSVSFTRPIGTAITMPTIQERSKPATHGALFDKTRNGRSSF